MNTTLEQIELAGEVLDLTDFAQEQTLLSESDAIQTKIDNIKFPEIDTTNIAKEATLQELKKSIENVDVVISGGVAAELAAGKQEIVDALNERGSDASTSQSLSSLANNIRESLALTFEDTEFYETPTNFINALNQVRVLRSSISSISAYNNNNYTSGKLFGLMPEIVGAELPNLTSCGPVFFGFSQTLMFLIVPSLVAPTFGSGSNPLRGTGNLRKLLLKFGGDFKKSGFFNEINKYLYDFSFSNVGYKSLSLDLWGPTTAYSNAETSLIAKKEWDDPNEPTETFATNRDKFLWYFRNHFMPCFGDCTPLGTNPTLSLASGLYNVVMAETDIAEYFAARNWNVASI